MIALTNLFERLVVPFLIVSGLILVGLIALAVTLRAVDEIRFRRRQRLIARYRPVVDALIVDESANAGAEAQAADGPPAAAVSASRQRAMEDLLRCPPAERPIVGALILAALKVTEGTVVNTLREATRTLGMSEQWLQQLADRRWWVRSEAARALGLAREERAANALAAALEDDHEEVRAAAVEALGLIAAPETLPVLIAGLRDPSRHQRARVVEALRGFGPSASTALVVHAHRQPEDTTVVAGLLGLIGGTDAVEDLVAWCDSSDAGLRAAAYGALGSIGLNEATYYRALRGLRDEDVNARAAAARALGLSHRDEAAPYLAQHLGEEWLVAAHSATALRRLGPAGLQELETWAGDPTQAGVLARQMLWEGRMASGARHPRAAEPDAGPAFGARPRSEVGGGQD